MSIVGANIMALVLTVPVIVLMGLFAYLCNRVSFYDGSLLWLFVVLAALTVAHELVHGIFWSIFAKGRWKSISFGFIVQNLSPYCTCNEGLTKVQYIIGAAMPTILLGIVPAICSVFLGSGFWRVAGTVMIVSGGGIWKLFQNCCCSAVVPGKFCIWAV